MKRALPNIFYFNPTCEYAVANGNKSWQPNRLLQKMEEDLSVLPLCLAQPKDIVLVKKMPGKTFLHSLQSAGMETPEFKCLKEAQSDKDFINCRKEKLLPWGWSPAVHKLLEPLKHSCSDDFKNSPVAHWKKEYRELYSKKFARNILLQLLSEIDCEKMLPSHLVTEICTEQEEVERFISKWGKIMIKAPWSSSGRGLQPITKTPVHPKVWEKIMGIIKEQGCAIVEPLLNKELDMAFQFNVQKGKVSYLGMSFFQTDSKGHYQKNFLNGTPAFINAEMNEFIRSIKKLIVPALMGILGKSQLATFYEGPFGVDTLVFSDSKKRLRINPCLEINVRHNMGMLSLKLNHFLSKNKKGIFSIFYRPGQSFYNFKNEMEKQHPLCIYANKIESGFLSLTPADENTLFGAYLLI